MFLKRSRYENQVEGKSWDNVREEGRHNKEMFDRKENPSQSDVKKNRPAKLLFGKIVSKRRERILQQIFSIQYKESTV